MALPDGTYTLTNVAFPTSQLTLSNGNALGNIVGLSSAQPQLWNVRNSGSVTTIQSGISSTTSFASVPASVRGVTLVGSPNTYSWVVKALPGAANGEVYIVDPGTGLTWTLSAGTNEAPINLLPRGSEVGSAAQWTHIKQ